MRLGTVQAKGLKGLRKFTNGIAVDFEDLPSGIIAIGGPNGSGKTTFLELPIIALYGEFPSRDGNKLADSVKGRDAFIDVEFSVEDRGVYRARVNIDGVSRLTDGVLTIIRPDGTEEQTDGKISTFRAAVAKEMPPLELVMASVFAAQKGDSFADLEKKDRKDLFASLLGLDAYENRATTARGAALAVERRLDELRAVLVHVASLVGEDEERAIEAEGNRLQAETQAASEARVKLETDRATADRILAGLKARAETFIEATKTAGVLTQRLAAALEDQERLKADFTKVGTVEQAAVAQAVAERDRRVAAIQVKLRALKTNDQFEDELHAMLSNINERARVAVTMFEKRVEKDASVIKQKDVIEDAKKALAAAQADFRENWTQSEGTRQTLQAMYDALNVDMLKHAELKYAGERLSEAQATVALLDRVPCHAEGIYATCELLVEANQEKAQIPTLQQSVNDREALEARLNQQHELIAIQKAGYEFLAGQRADIEKRMAAEELFANLAEPLAQAEARMHEHKADIARVEQEAEAERTRTRVFFNGALVGRDKARDDLDIDIEDAQTQYLRAEMSAQELARDERAHIKDREKMVALKASAIGEELDAALELARQNQDAHEGLVAAEGMRQATERAWTENEATLAALRVQITTFERRRLMFQQRAAERDALQATVKGLKTDMAEWTALSRILGRDGLPVLEIDAAGPGVSALANDLLQSCFGTRFTVELITQEPKVDGKGYKEVFDLRVWDSEEANEPRDLKELSGGEEVIVDEAIKSAIALHMGQQNLFHWRTCWRDETVGSLDKASAVRYVTMLRRIKERGGFERVLFIAHDPDIRGMADAQILLDNGDLSLHYPPYAV